MSFRRSHPPKPEGSPPKDPMSPNTCACIIPFHNEEARILEVLRVVAEVRNLDQILCVDDGSDDDSATRIERHFPGVQIVRLPRSGGKAQAIEAGLGRARSSHVLLLDADLHGLDVREIERAIDKAVSHPAIDMIILRRVRAGLHSKLVRGDVLFSGERILKTQDLRRILHARPEKYQLEIAINKFMIDHDKVVYWMPSSAKNTYKVEKVGLWAGLKQEAQMISEMISYRGLSAYAEQFLSFARERAPEPRRNL